LDAVVSGGWQALLLLAVGVASGCGQRPPSHEVLTPARAASVQQEVETFMRAVARDVTAQGPIAWRQHFADKPAFFMVADGRMAFPTGTAAMTAIPELVRALPHIELRWGEGLRVDPLTTHLAAVAAPYREVTVNAAGLRAESTGFFTGTAEEDDGRWQFRNAHWSEPLPSPGAP
jgi:hypothetical protein